MDASRLLTALIIAAAIAPRGQGQNTTGPPPAAATPAVAPRPKFTRQPDFGIPFQLTPNPQNPAAEVQLYASTDQGANWRLYQRQPTTAERFVFTAPADGEYWFAVRTVDRQGQLIAHRGWTPELIVVVDTQLPRLELDVRVDSQGEIQASWVAQDPNLAPETFRLQYQPKRTGKWEDVQIQTPAADDWRQQWEHRAEWWLQPTGDEVLVRAEVLDRAGNSTLVNELVSLAQVAGRNNDAFPGRLVDSRRPNSAVGPIPPDDVAPADESRWNNESRDRSATTSPNDDPRSRWTDQTSSMASDGLKQQVNDFARPEPVASQVAPPVANRYAGGVEGADTAGQRPHISPSPNFELAYDLFDVGPNGASLVELWYTRNNARTWELYGSDDDKKSPMRVRVEQEGLYGFRLVVYSNDAPQPRPPQDGEPADIWVGVDWTKPVGRILGARYGEGLSKNSLIITWEAADALLAERPITLNISESRSGPWSHIAAGIPNSGSFEWRLDRRPPAQLYLQLEVRDLAGHVTTDVLERPILTQGHAPKGRIKEMLPLGRMSLHEATSRR